MQLKSLLVAAIIALTGLSLSSCVEGGSYYGPGGYSSDYYNGGYYSGGGVIIGGGGFYSGPRYRSDRYRYRGDHRQYHRPGRPQYSGRHPEYRHDGRPGGRHHRLVPPRSGGNR